MPPLTIRLLGSMEISRGAENMPLPHSKKTRALLGFLAATCRPHRRERLCSLLWDVADDPRAALRWSLSKLRSLVDEPRAQRIVADRETVSFEPKSAVVDVLAVKTALSDKEPGTAELQRLAGLFRGEFLEGLDLPDFHDYQAWCIAMRGEARRNHASALNLLVRRLGEQPEEALTYARSLVGIDPADVTAQESFIRLLVQTGRRTEAEQQYAAACRLLNEQGLSSRLQQQWLDVTAKPAAVPVPPAQTVPHRPASSGKKSERTPQLIGREAEFDRIMATLREVQTRRHEEGLLLTGEPGIGKTNLVARLAFEVRERGGTVLNGNAYEVESGRPYGPWIDALRRVPATSVGNTIGSDLVSLVPELPFGTSPRQSRESLFGAVVDLIAARAHSAAPVLVALDDAQWLDEASAELLHYASRMSRNRPVLFVLAARQGELSHNAPMQRVVVSMKKDGLLRDLAVGPLSREHTDALVRAVEPNADLERVYSLSAGNPLYALEIARSSPHPDEGVPSTLAALVQGRVAGLPAPVIEALRWCSVLGRIFSARRAGEVTRLPAEELMLTFETLERLCLIRAVPAELRHRGDYEFLNDVVRHVVYADLSEPRRRLMHQRVAEAIHQLEGMDEQSAADIAHHAALGGDAGRAAGACVAAARRCLRLFANAQAEALARKGMEYALQLKEPEQVQRMLEFSQVSMAARRPDEPVRMAEQINALAERALDFGCSDHARLGFHLLSLLRWEEGDWTDAERNVMRAEQVSRGAGEREKVLAMADAARCLAMLERDLATAEKLVFQAGVLGAQLGIQPAAIPIAEGLLRVHEGDLEHAATLFEHARLLARTEGDRHGEYQALESLVMAELQRGDYGRATALSAELVAIGDKLRDGSEAPFARALASICRYGTGEISAAADLDGSIEQLRLADAKHRLLFVFTCAAQIELRAGKAVAALERASNGLDIARRLERRSEVVLNLSLLAQACAALKRRNECARWTRELRAVSPAGVSLYARTAMEKTLKGDKTWSG